jgi:hypothetical protein
MHLAPHWRNYLWPAALALLGGGLVLAFFLLRAGHPDDDSPGPPGEGFQERAAEAGITFRMKFLSAEQGEHFKINLYDHGCGVAVADYNGDGRDDIYFVNQLGPNALYKNNGDGTFTDVTKKAGVGLGDRICVGAVFADFDNDGHQDLFVTSTRGGNVLFRNQGDGTFKDVTKKAGLVHVGHSQTAVFFDYDNDGYLDLFVTNSAKWTTDSTAEQSHYHPGLDGVAALIHCPKETNILYHNNGDGTFTDVTATARLKGPGWGGDVAVFDYDEDGYLDLLVTNMFGRSTLYHNNGDGTFTDVTAKTLKRTSWGAIGCKAFDFNNDGRLDLFITDMHSDMWMPIRQHSVLDFIRKNEQKKFRYVSGPRIDQTEDPVRRGMLREEEQELEAVLKFRHKDVIFGNTLFQNLGRGRFKEVSDRAGLETFWPWGIATGDYDNDGYEDVFIPSGMGYPFFYWRNYLMMNNGNGTFTDRSRTRGIEPPPRGRYLPETIRGERMARSSRCAAVADFSGTGRLDLVVNNFNDRPFFFQNNFPRKNYVAFRLRGTRSNRDAVGALVRVYVGKEVMVRQVQAAGGYLSQSSKTVHFGLGSRKHIDRVEIRWPRGRLQTLVRPAINKLHAVTEPRN